MAAPEVIIVGGGPAGLSAALILGRCRRRVTLYDNDSARNRASRGIHGYVGLDGIAPREFRSRGRAELSAYGVELKDRRVVEATRVEGGFEIRDDQGEVERARFLLLATGVRDELPALPGAAEFYGRGVFPCPYCDGWELRDQGLAAYAWGPESADLALGLTTWSRDVVLFTDGHEPPPEPAQARMQRHGVRVCRERIVALEGDERGLRAVVLEGGMRVPRAALFLYCGQRVASPLPAMLGCKFEESGPVRTFEKQTTDVPGLYLAGDAAGDVEFAIVAAAHGARAAHDINQELRRKETV